MINDYSTLTAAIADELARADLLGVIPTFIQLAEADMNRVLRLRQMQVTVTGAVVANVITLPADCRAVQSLRLAYGGTYHEIRPLVPERLAETLATGFPVGYVVIGDEAHIIGGTGVELYALTYRQAIPSLSDAEPQNWLILREPGLYLYSALAHSAPFLKDDQRLVTWATLAKAIRDGMKAEDDSTAYGNAPTMMAAPYAP